MTNLLGVINHLFLTLRGFQLMFFAEIYPCVLPGLVEKESIMDKRELCRHSLCNIQSILDETHTKTLRFEKHETIKDSLCKLTAIYNPLSIFLGNTCQVIKFQIHMKLHLWAWIAGNIGNGSFIFWVMTFIGCHKITNWNLYFILLSTRN